VWVNAVRHSAAIQEVDHDGVTDLSPNDGAKNPQPLRLRLADRESCVRVLDVAGLLPVSVSAPGVRNWAALNQVHQARAVVPDDIFGGDIVVTRSSGGDLSIEKRK
jgi:hypothetical protein